MCIRDRFEGGDEEKGKKLFESVGCLACHTLNGKGEKHAPDLSNIGNKVSADWLVTWVGGRTLITQKVKCLI